MINEDDSCSIYLHIECKTEKVGSVGSSKAGSCLKEFPSIGAKLPRALCISCQVSRDGGAEAPGCGDPREGQGTSSSSDIKAQGNLVPHRARQI